ncbi:MAG TPA: serine/threonine-protein kinase [Polyangiales bacterium]|nr:serine/threonine-protein kinase [Polyangiales bacterium]
MVSEQLTAPVPAPISPARPLRSLGKYRLLELIGSGAMGDVYRAEHVLLGRRVAVKVLRKELAHEQSLVERFFSEARAVNLVGHPHIVEVTDFARERDGTVWFVMELLDGSDLGSLLRNDLPSLRRSLEIARQICDALDAVHGVGIIHRDIKPENVFLVQRDGRDFVKLLDFGIARVPEPPDGVHNTLRGVVMGTPPYMAPEQARGLEIDPRSDLYAVGAVLFELITGRLVFEQPTLRAMLADITLKAPPRLSEHAQLPSSVRDQLDALLARCLAKDPEQRPETAKALALELCEIAERLEAWALAGDELPAEPAPESAELERSPRDSAELLAVCRPKWPARALWLGAALVAGATGLWFGPSTQANQTPSVEAGQPGIAAAQAAPLNIALDAPRPSAPQPPAAAGGTAAGVSQTRGAQALAVAEHAHEPATEPRERTRRLTPSEPAPPQPGPSALPSEPKAYRDLSLASAPAQRELDPEKLLDPFAGE